MRNKWFVLLVALPGLPLALLALHTLLTGAADALTLVPAALAGAFFYAAYKIAKAPSFAPSKGRSPNEYSATPHVTRRQRAAESSPARKAPPK